MSPIMSQPPAGEQPGIKKLGRYECTEPLGGDGGFETYRGRIKGLTGLDRSFAVKVLRLKRSESASAVVEPFIQAAKRSAALANPRIATVVDTGAGEGVVFAVTPFMEGLDLSHFLAAARQAGLLVTGKDDRARQWYSLVAYVGAEIARGLHAAHTQSPPLVHGALCPGNVFITSRGAVRLLDFGLRAAVRRPFEPRPRRLLPYIAPELAAPSADGTLAGDMYALGVLLGELASGDPPPQGRRASEMQILLSTLPEDLGSLIGRLVSLSPTTRPSAEETVALLAASYADISEPNLVAALSSLVQHLVSDQAQAPQPAENPVAMQGAQEAADEAPPPPSEVAHDDAFEASPPARAFEPMVMPAAEVADLSVPDPDSVVGDLPVPVGDSTFDVDQPLSMADVFTAEDSLAGSAPPHPGAAEVEERFGSDPTSIGDRSLIDKLLKQSRLTEPLSRPTALRPPATHLASRAEDSASAPSPRGPTQPGFSPIGPLARQTPPPVPASGESFAEFSLEPTSSPDVAAPEVALSPEPLPEPVSAQSSMFENSPSLEGAGSSLVGYETPPATWGARALAALGGQAGIAPADEPSGLGLLDQGLLDRVQAELGSPVSLPGSPSLAGPDDGYLRSPQILSTGEPSLAMDRDSSLVDEEPPRQGDALLEDQLVDAPEGLRVASSWPEADSGVYGGSDMHGMPAPSALPFREAPSAEVAQVVASVVDEPVTLEAQAYLDEGAPPSSATPAYYDDSGEPLPDALPVQPSHAPTLIAFAPQPAPVSRPAPSAPQVLPAVPSWAQSPEIPVKPKSRALVWGLAGMVLGASIVLGGLAGFMVGTRGKSMSPVLEAVRAPSVSKPRVAAPHKTVDDVVPQAEPAPSRPAVAVKDQGVAKASQSAAPAKAPAGAQAKPPVPSEKVLPEGHAASTTAPVAAWGKGVADAPGSGELVSVSVASQPEGAAVWINGKERGRTPLQVKVQAGPARVLIILAGHALAAADITASEGAKVSKQLTAIQPPLEGEARFRAECTTLGKLPIMIDGKETGVLCPFSKLRVDPGVHKIGLFVPSLGTVREKEVTLRPGVRSIVFAD